MKIVQVAYKSDISGGERVLLDLATCLKRRGHEVIAVVPAPGSLPEALGAIGVPVEVIPFRKTYDLTAVVRLARFLRRRNPDVLHSHSMLTSILCRPAGFLARVPVSVSTEHLTMELARGGRGVGGKERAKARYYRALDNATSRFNQAVVAVSEAVKRDLIEQGMRESRIVVIRNGIEIIPPDQTAGARLRESLGIGLSDPVAGMVGRLSPQKDYPTFLRAAKRIAAVFPAARFLIAGAGPLRESLMELSGNLGLGEAVVFLGHRPDIGAVVSALDIFVLSSRWEGLPLAVLEAQAAGRPVVATAVPGTAEAVAEGETGFLVPLGDDRALADRAILLFRDRGVRERTGEAGRQRVEREFNRERMADDHERLYRSLAADREAKPASGGRR
jgi:glycosyltransferase involved in cell wall biosynthesis